jgi:hypothetical protein
MRPHFLHVITLAPLEIEGQLASAGAYMLGAINCRSVRRKRSVRRWIGCHPFGSEGYEGAHAKRYPQNRPSDQRFFHARGPIIRNARAEVLSLLQGVLRIAFRSGAT